MPTTGVINTTDLTLFIDDTAVACATDASITVTDALREILCKDNAGWKTFKSGVKEFIGSGSGLYAFDAPAGSGGIFSMDTIIAGTEVTVKFSTGTTGDTYYEGQAYFSNVTLESSGVGENASYSFDLTGSGAIAKGTES